MRTGVDPEPVYVAQAGPATQRSLSVFSYHMFGEATIFSLIFMMPSMVFISDIYNSHDHVWPAVPIACEIITYPLTYPLCPQHRHTPLPNLV